MTTWSTTDKSAGMTLSNGNLKASQPSSTGTQFVRSSTGKTTGKAYCEITWGAPGGGGFDAIGFATSSATATNWITNGTGGLVGWSNNGAFFNGNNSAATGGACTTGDVACYAIDLVNKRVWVRKNSGNWNSTAGNDPATNVGGVDISALFPSNALFMMFTSTGQWSASDCTVNFGATAFAQTVPGGFTAWDTAAAPRLPRRVQNVRWS